jgi:hypothetical protein
MHEGRESKAFMLVNIIEPSEHKYDFSWQEQSLILISVSQTLILPNNMPIHTNET